MRGKVRILYLGAQIYDHPVLQGYIDRAIRQKGLRVIETHRYPSTDPDLPLRIQEFIREGELDLLVFAAGEDHALVGRILCTLGNDLLQASEEGMLAPASCRDLVPGSYLYRLEGQRINVIEARPGHTLPPILLESVETEIYHLFLPREERDEELRRVLLERSSHLQSVEILPGWHRLTLYREGELGTWEELRPWRGRMIPGPSLVEALIRYLSARKKTITFAESCTGGRIAAAFTSQPGASEILEGSYVTYANRIKAGWLGVREETLQRHGAVSRECVLEMAAGAQRNLNADIAIAVSGIAGPTGAVPGKPIGTVWLCLRNGERVRTERLQLQGDRNAIQELSVLHALRWIVESEKEIFEFFSKIS